MKGKVKKSPNSNENCLSRILCSVTRPLSQSPAMSVVIILCSMAPAVFSLVIALWYPWLILAGIAEGTVLALAAAWIVALCPDKARRWVRLALTIPAAFWAMVECIHIGILKSPFSPQSALLIVNTNAREAAGFFTQFYSLKAIIYSLVMLAIAVVLSIWSFRSRWRINRCRPLVSLVIILTAGAGLASFIDILTLCRVRNIEQRIKWEVVDPGIPTLSRLDRANYAPPFPKFYHIYKVLEFDRHDIDEFLSRQDILFRQPASSAADDDLQIIVVVGESFIKSHTPLYGYHLPTTPRMMAERDSGNLVTFSDVITTANFTTISLRNLFSLNTLNGSGPAKGKWTKAAYFPAVMKRAGFRVDFFTNQFIPHQSDDLSRIFFSDLDLDSVYTRYNDWRHDDDLIFISKALKAGNDSRPGPRLTIYHLNGQHFPPSWHYPPEKEYEIFTAADIPANRPWLDESKRTIVAQYANATHYNDRVIGTIMDAFRGRNAVMIYFSDHGEEMYDTAPFGNRNAQHPDDPQWMHRQFDIPFIIWMSPEYQRRNPEQTAAIRAASNRRGDLGDLGQSVLWLGKVKSPFAAPQNAIVAPEYQQPAQRVTAMCYQYPQK